MKRKNILDEMKEQKRLQIESRALWIAFFGLAFVILVQSAISKGSLSSIYGEIAVMIAVSLYLVPNYLSHGIWDTTLKPTFITNLLISGITGLGMALYLGVVSYVRYGKLAGSIATATFVFCSTAILTTLLLTFCAWLYSRRIQKLENPANDDVDIAEK